MLRTELKKQISELVIQALSDESINHAEPMTDFDIKVLSATIERLISEGLLPETSDLVIEPRKMMSLIQNGNLTENIDQQTRKALRRFREVIINLSSEPEIKILN